ncbi:carboxylate-amine ligase [Leucobacter triazinivorans]|uniref:Putative glutamate--cysteine ligase 2 n=1 Tax=Leucobacter triazinivorans TaxID=1784719 RepID=A0A4P6KIG1_9MICO|nr:YbdK family carboxylate-amine ligase [Leucobacter triazinivorans]QBE49881.1 YbdK family carboxylate-amine ligase [Leucobacter triazinivorans]
MAADSTRAPRFGVEEEFMLLDAGSGRPRDGAEKMIGALPGLRAEHEFFHSQLETATPVCESGEEALDSLEEFRAGAALAADGMGLVLAGTGLPPIGGDEPGRVVAKPRYLEIAEASRGSVARYYSTGAHFHVEVPSRDAGVGVIARFARWSPVLAALAANSPVHIGERTGYASWRYLLTQQWPTAGYPPAFADGAAYDRVVSGLVHAGALVDTALVNWAIRLSERFPTIELRTADAQLHAEDSVALALIFRALAARGLREHELAESLVHPQPDLLRGAHWRAARDGVSGDLFDPIEGEPRPAFHLVDEMIEHVSDELDASGDAEAVQRYIERRRRDRGPAQQQLDAWDAEGMAGLLTLYRAAA